MSWSNRVLAVVALTAGLLLAPFAPAGAAPDIRQWTTENGARVLYVHAPEIPMVDARVTFSAGSARDGEHPGIARLVSNLLMSGTESRDADALARALEREGAEVSTGSQRDMGWVELRSLADDEHLRPVAEVVGELLARPAFPQDEIQRRKDQQRTALENQAQSPGEIARKRFWQALYEGHPYGHDPLGTRESVEAIERADLRAFHERFYAARNASVAIVGAIDRARAERLAQTLVGGLPAGAAAPALPPAPELAEDRTIRVDFPSTQAHVLVGRPGVARGYERWPALYVANHVLGGGGFTSRLFSEVREERGLVYSVYSYASPMTVSGPFLVALQTRGDQADEALGIVREQLARFVDEGPEPAEVRDAVRNITGGFPLRIDSNGDLTGYLGMMGFYGLPLDYLDAFPARVGDVDAQAARAAFADAIGQRPRVTVIVGGSRSAGGGQAAQ